MKKEDIIIAIHQPTQNTIDYELINDFTTGLTKGFTQNGIKTVSIQECNTNNITPNLAIGFNECGLEHWQKLLNNQISNIMWTTDSIFCKNTEIVKQFATYPKFILFDCCSDDINAVKHYQEKLLHGYIPFGIDLDFWKPQNIEKDLNLTYIGNIQDPEILMDKIKTTMPELVFNLMLNFINAAISNPGLSLWHLYSYFNKQANLQLDKEQYALIAQNISEIITSKQKINMIQTLKDFELTILGNDVWNKYKPENAKLITNFEYKDIPTILNRSKLTLHTQPFGTTGGISKDLLQATATKTPVLCMQERISISEFKQSINYFNPQSNEDLKERTNFCLNNLSLCNEQAQTALEITQSRHTWANRAKSILDIIDIN